MNELELMSTINKQKMLIDYYEHRSSLDYWTGFCTGAGIMLGLAAIVVGIIKLL